jgi:hypothetical protein
MYMMFAPQVIDESTSPALAWHSTEWLDVLYTLAWNGSEWE